MIFGTYIVYESGDDHGTAICNISQLYLSRLKLSFCKTPASGYTSLCAQCSLVTFVLRKCLSLKASCLSFCFLPDTFFYSEWRCYWTYTWREHSQPFHFFTVGQALWDVKSWCYGLKWLIPEFTNIQIFPWIYITSFTLSLVGFVLSA